MLTTDMLVSLMGVLMRFRERPIAVSGDIRQIFQQIKVYDGYCDAGPQAMRNCAEVELTWLAAS